MDEVEYTPQPGGNRWRLVKALPAVSAGPAVEDDRLTALTLDLPASYRYLNVPGEAVAALLAGVTLPPDSTLVYEIQLAVQETCTNIVEHALAGGGRVQVTLSLDRAAGCFVIDTWDAGGRTFDLAAIPDRFELAAPSPMPRAGLLRGGALLFASATLVNAGNYLFNLILGRWLGPAAFADLSLIVTLFLVTSFLTAGVQTPAARFSAIFAAERNLASIAGLRRLSLRLALLIGLGLAAVFALGAPLWTSFFSASSPISFILFGLFVPFFLLQGVDRGLLQGRTRFGFLAGTYQVEMWSRLLLSLAFVALGWGVNGAVGGIAFSFVAAWLIARRVAADLPAAQPLAPALRREVLLFTGPVLVAQLGQILINNSDVLIVRRFFPAEEAGLYASLALTGRIVFFATWSVVTAMFPIVAQRFSRGQPHRHLLFVSLAAVLAGSLIIVAAAYLFPEAIVQALFGPAYLAIAPLLWVYALATMFYALANVVINYRLSIGSTGGTYLAIAAGVAQVALLWTFHASLSQVVLIQLALMAGLFVVLIAWDLARSIFPLAPARSRA
jgi:O-antigen/teichoic acid export membrane protein